MKSEFDHMLGKMSEEGLLNETYSEKNQDLIYSLTDKGEKESIDLLKKDPNARMYLFEIAYNMIRLTTKDNQKAFLIALEKIGKKLKEDTGKSILKDIIKAYETGEAIGLEITNIEELKKLEKKWFKKL